MTDTNFDRRKFFGAGVALAGGALIAASPARAEADDDWEAAMEPADSWMDKPGTRHRIAFDCTTPKAVDEGLDFANNYIATSVSGYDLKPSQLGVIVIVRHWGTPYAYNNAIWGKYGSAFVKAFGLDGALAKNAATANPLYTRPADSQAQPKGFEWFDNKYLDKLIPQGVTFAVCGLATRFVAAKLAGAAGNSAAIYDELAGNLIPNAHMVPSGIAAVGHVQEHGYALATVVP